MRIEVVINDEIYYLHDIVYCERRDKYFMSWTKRFRESLIVNPEKLNAWGSFVFDREMFTDELDKIDKDKITFR